MIFASLNEMASYDALLPGLAKASILLQKLLEKGHAETLKAGSYTTDIPCFRYNVAEYETQATPKQYEYHKKEVDVQIMISGSEKMEYAGTIEDAKFKGIDIGTIPENSDIAFCDAPTTLSLTASPGTFAIFFPGELHKPGVSIDSVPHSAKKVIFKIAIN